MSKLWIIKAREGLEPSIDPWNPVYDTNTGFVVRATTEERARKLAAGDAVTEIRNGVNPWLDPSLSTCIEITADGPEEILLVDYHES